MTKLSLYATLCGKTGSKICQEYYILVCKKCCKHKHKTMKKTLKAIILGTGLSLFMLNPGFAQFEDIGLILSGGVNDAQLMLTEYMRPLANSLGANLNGGWYNTAKVHGTLGFDITFTTSFAFAPDDAKLYDISQLALDAVVSGGPDAPTFSGEKGLGPVLSYQQDVTGFPQPITIVEYDHPGGTGLGFIPSPMINAGIGLPKGFEIIGRYMPKVKFKGMQSGLWGVGLKHDIGQWIPFVKRVPVLHFTLMYGYTNLNLNAKLNPITPQVLSDISPVDIQDNTTGISWDDQNFDLLTQGHTANFLVGANLPVVAFYGGVGISITQTNLKLNGYYPIPVLNVSNPLNPFSEVTNASAMENPIDIEIKNSDGSVTKPRFNVGIRFKFAVITLHFDYTYANYSVATGGLGISLR